MLSLTTDISIEIKDRGRLASYSVRKIRCEKVSDAYDDASTGPTGENAVLLSELMKVDVK